MRSRFFDAEQHPTLSPERWAKQNARLLRVGLGPDVLAAKGAMVSYRGALQFHHEKSARWPSWPRRS